MMPAADSRSAQRGVDRANRGRLLRTYRRRGPLSRSDTRLRASIRVNRGRQLQPLGYRTEDDRGGEQREKQSQLGHGRDCARLAVSLLAGAWAERQRRAFIDR